MCSSDLFIFVMVLTFFGYLQVKVEFNTAKLLFKGQPLRDTLNEIDRRMIIIKNRRNGEAARLEPVRLIQQDALRPAGRNLRPK